MSCNDLTGIPLDKILADKEIGNNRVVCVPVGRLREMQEPDIPNLHEETERALRERIATLETALEPFQQVDFTRFQFKDERVMYGFDDAYLTYGDFRKARALLSPPIPPDSQPPTPQLSEYARGQVKKVKEK